MTEFRRVLFRSNAFLGGGELEAEYIAWKSLHFYGSLAYTYAENLKNVAGFKANSPLPQIPPLQGQLSAFYDNGGWLLRLDMIANAAQHRYMLEYGNVVGKDLGKTQGFVTLNLQGWMAFASLPSWMRQRSYAIR